MTTAVPVIAGLTGNLFLLVLETDGHHDAPDDAGRTEDDERILPAELIGDISGKPPGKDNTHIIGSLMDGHRTCPGIGVILSQKRIIGRAEESLSTTSRHTSHKDEHHHTAGKSCEHSRDAPEKDSYGSDPFAAQTVSGHSPKRYHTGIAQIEYGGNQSHRSICKLE